ncbi:MAG TPA: pentapeptide repeat-containing protein, partial [Thermoanaerobaculia bacterium]|nr:pentapeptide repeat-containing protein [Thermoanaerobaculia bacterium]
FSSAERTADPELKGLSWQGCGVASSSKKRILFSNVRFEGCFLLGTIFEGIDFAGCEFVRCELKGALFAQCNFGPNELGKPTVFRECHSNVAVVGGSIESLEFHDCQLNQPAIKNVSLKGDVVYAQGSKIIQGLFEQITVEEGKDAFILVESDSQAAYCFADEGCLSLLRVERANPELPNSRLPDEFRTRR